MFGGLNRWQGNQKPRHLSLLRLTCCDTYEYVVPVTRSWLWIRDASNSTRAIIQLGGNLSIAPEAIRSKIGRAIDAAGKR